MEALQQIEVSNNTDPKLCPTNDACFKAGRCLHGCKRGPYKDEEPLFTATAGEGEVSLEAELPDVPREAVVASEDLVLSGLQEAVPAAMASR